MTRKTHSVQKDANDALEPYKRDDESWTDFYFRLADICEAHEASANETFAPDAEAIAQAVAAELDLPDTEDIATATSRRTADELETRLRR
jgi:hypothetical protein